MPDDSIMEIKVYGIKDGETVYYSRAHQMKLQMEKDYGIYKGTAIKKEVLLHEDRYVRACDSIGYEFNLNGVSEKAPKGLGDQFEKKAEKILDGKYQTTGTLVSVGDKVKNILNLESFKYYLQMPGYIYPESETIQRFGFMTFVFNSNYCDWICDDRAGNSVFSLCICNQQETVKTSGKICSPLLPGRNDDSVCKYYASELIMYKQMGAYNNYVALLLPFLYPYGFYVYLYKGFFDQIPASYFEAAELDGAGSFYLYSKICMPLSKPIISLIALQTFIGNWNDFFWAWLVTEDQKLWTLNVALYNISNNVATKQNALMGLAVVTITPVILLSILFSKQLKQSIVASGVKG